MRYLTLVSLVFLPLATVCPTAVGQAVAEYGLGTGRAATTTVPARNVASGISGVFDNLSKAAGADAGTTAPGSAAPSTEARRTTAHKTKRRTQAKQSTLGAKAATPDASPATPVYEDPRQIPAGIEYNELVRRYGPPSMSIATGPGRSTLLYSTGDSSYQVELGDGKVIAAPAPKSE